MPNTPLPGGEAPATRSAPEVAPSASAPVLRALGEARAHLGDLEQQELDAYRERGEFLATFPSDFKVIREQRERFQTRVVDLKRKQLQAREIIAELEQRAAREMQQQVNAATRDQRAQIRELLSQSLRETAPALERAWDQLEAAALAFAAEGQRIEALAADVLRLHYPGRGERALEMQVLIGPHASGHSDEFALAVVQRTRRLLEILGASRMKQFVRIDESAGTHLSITGARRRDAAMTLDLFGQGAQDD